MKSEIISNLSDEELYKYICKLGYDQSNLEYSDTSRNKYVDAFFAIHMLEAEVFNGGFDQFFQNYGYEEYVDDALFGLEIIGEPTLKNILNEAILIHLKEPEEKRHLRNPEYDKLDDEFYDFDESDEFYFTKVNHLLIKIVRGNLDLFLQ